MNITHNNFVVADIGGTNARFAVVDKQGELKNIRVLSTSNYSGPEAAIRDYIEGAGLSVVSAICLAIACPVKGDVLDMSNNYWKFSCSELEKSLAIPLHIINDFTAQAYCLGCMDEEQIRWIGDARPRTGQGKVVIGPGTGLGVAFIQPDGVVLSSEGGHSGFSPSSSHQVDLLRVLWNKFGRVSIERVISGQGLENLYWANSVLCGEEVEISSQEVTSRVQAGEKLAIQTIEDFFDIFASACGDMALSFGAEGGVYLTGGVLEKLVDFFDETKFRSCFEKKGRFTKYCESIPIGIIKVENPGLLGCFAALQNYRDNSLDSD